MQQLTEKKNQEIGHTMYLWAKDLFSICRSITGNGVRQTLAYIKKLIPNLTVHEVPSGTPAFDWIVPDEWNIEDAYVLNSRNERIIDFKKNNLHVMGYSEPVEIKLSLEKLKPYLHTLQNQPDAIPYVTSYYKRHWGFCLSLNDLQKMEPGEYTAVIKSTLIPGSLTYADLIIPGKEEKEVLLSTYICHPSMANNELSGPVVTTALTRWLSSLSNLRYTYRIVFVPETIGSIVYLSRNIEMMKQNTIAGFVLTCVGDNRAYSFLPSRSGNTLADRVARHVLSYYTPGYHSYSFLERGSDERQYCHPLVDLPVISIMRSKYDTYPEYHTSLDNLDFICPSGLLGAFEAIKHCISIIEKNVTLRTTIPCEPQLGKRGLYPTLSYKGSATEVQDMLNLLAIADGKQDLVSLADNIGIPASRCHDIARTLIFHNLLEIVN